MIALWTGRAESARTAACLQNAEILLTETIFHYFHALKKRASARFSLLT